jgi:hypothetical protein
LMKGCSILLVRMPSRRRKCISTQKYKIGMNS